MRTIKFRAWDTKNKRMIDGWDLEYLNETFESKKDGVFVIGDDLIIMQYTDLFDRKGFEIAEGDIVRFKYEGDDGFWNNEYSKGYYSKPIVYSEGEYFIDDIFTPLWEHTPKVKIIGNIYENSNLIK